MPFGIAWMKSDNILKSSMMARKMAVRSYVNSISHLKKYITKNIQHNVVISKNEKIDFN